MPLLKQIGKGTSIAFATSSDGFASTTSSTLVGCVRSASLSGGGGTDVDTFCLDSTGNFRTFKRGPVDPGSLNFELMFSSTDGNHKKLGTLYETGEEKVWRVKYPSTTTTPRMFRGYVSDVGEEIPLDDVITRSVTIKISGHPGINSTAGVALSS